MKLDMRILHPDRNKTEHLWKCLESAAIMPTVLVMAAITAANLPRGDMSRIIFHGIVTFIALGHMVTYRRLVRKLKQKVETLEHPPA